MSPLIRLVYASRSTFAPSSGHQGLDPGLARILAKSRKNNAERQIVGGLLFGDGCFLQCLEGNEAAIDALYAKIEADPRHRDLRVLSRQAIAQRSFAAWAMKFVPGERALAGLLTEWGQQAFDPYALSPAQLDAALRVLLQQADDAGPLAAETPPGEAAAQAPAATGRKGRSVWTWVSVGLTWVAIAGMLYWDFH